jgi:hypothetical protein
MSSNNLPESEVNWLYGIDRKYRITMNSGIGSVYPVDILPPKLRGFVKRQSLSTEFINMGPSMGCPDGMVWSIWGWKSLPTDSSDRDADWHNTIVAQRDPPSMEDLQKKIKHIQTELGELSMLIARYSVSV